MPQRVIENPILNSPFNKPTRHFKFDDEGITNEVVESRRISTYFVPIPKPRKKNSKAQQLTFDTEWTQDRIEENKLINRIRERVERWRILGYPNITRTSRLLLNHWLGTDRERERKLFFCQIEALETIIYITEAARRQEDIWIDNELVSFNAEANPGLYRIALKMATGSGKTVVMAMIITWQTLNKVASPQDNRFSDTFLIVTPGITIKDRLRVLFPNDPQNYYDKLDIVPMDLKENLGKVKIHITNFHAFKQREKTSASKIAKEILGQGGTSPFTETPEQMVRRVCRELGAKKQIIVINDEAHHCYRRKVDGEDIKLTGDERKEMEKREEYARVWISGLEAVQKKNGIKVVYDLSATPFFLRGSGYKEGTLFPWVVSDFSLIDAIESGIVKVPRVPVADNTMIGDEPIYRLLWPSIKDELPKKGRSGYEDGKAPQIPAALQAALHSLYNNYEKSYQQWEQNVDAREKGLTPPVMIVVCNNTTVSKMIFDYIAGYEKPVSNVHKVLVPGNLPIFSNVEKDIWKIRPNTILIDSEQLESGEGMSDDFKKIASREIEELKSDYRLRFPGRDVDKITDDELLREVMNTVGKQGKLGEHVKCVVSVSMLTEGWDANTVTHVLGVRAFGTQLLCEQVVGRALRRMSYAPDENGMFQPEYAEVYGVPFSFIPCSGSGADKISTKEYKRVHSMEDRSFCRIEFPRVIGYRYEFKGDTLDASFTEKSVLPLTTEIIATWTQNAPIVGKMEIHTLDDLKKRRIQEVAFLLSKLILEKYFPSFEPVTKEDIGVQAWFFPRLLEITRQWLKDYVKCEDGTFPQMLLLVQLAQNACDKIYQGIVSRKSGEKVLKPILDRFDTVGSTSYVDFNTVRPVFQTDPERCHINYVVADTSAWEQKMAQTLEGMEEVRCYVKNDHLGFYIPYSFNGRERRYHPDFIVRVDDGRGAEDLLNLILEVSGEALQEKDAKVSAAKSLWVPAVNNDGRFGRWDFIEIRDPWSAKSAIRKSLSKQSPLGEGTPSNSPIGEGTPS